MQPMRDGRLIRRVLLLLLKLLALAALAVAYLWLRTEAAWQLGRWLWGLD